MSIIPIKGLQFVSSNSPTKPPLTAPPPPSQAVCGQCSTLLDFQGCFLQALTRLQDQMLTMTDGSYPRSMGCLPPRLWGISWNAQLSSDTIVSHFWDGCWQPPIVGVAPRCSVSPSLTVGELSCLSPGSESHPSSGLSVRISSSRRSNLLRLPGTESQEVYHVRKHSRSVSQQ